MKVSLLNCSSPLFYKRQASTHEPEGDMQISHLSLKKEVGLFQLTVRKSFLTSGPTAFWSDGVFSSLKVKEWLRGERMATKVPCNSHV